MQFSQNLNLKQSQNLLMSPQLQQAIKLLQMTNIELNEYIQEQFNNNPLVDIKQVLSEKIAAPLLQDNKNYEGMKNSDLSYENSFSDHQNDKYDMGMDYDYASNYNFKNFNGGEPLNEKHYNQNISQALDLRQYLSNQLFSSCLPQDMMLIGSYLIGELSETGYLHESASEIAAQLMETTEKVETVIKFCQQFEPAGVFARSLSECLTLQLQDRDLYTPKFEVLLNNLEDLASNKVSQLLSKVNVTKDTLIEMIKTIKMLHPKPGYIYSNDPIMPIIPDVFICEKENGGWYVELNQSTMPRAIINQKYSMYLQRGSEGLEKKTKKYLKESLNQASWLVRTLEQRSDTILRVATEILRQQDGFFAYGFSYLRPMNLKVVAEELGLHESTVSRVTAGKYLRCARGLFEMKFFFMSGVNNSEGEASISSQSVKYEIKKMIDTETDDAVLNDDDIVEILKQKEIIVARRTVAKYREALGIPSSIKRRRLKNSFLKKMT